MSRAAASEAPRGLELDVVEVDGEALVVVSFPTAPVRAQPSVPLAPAELEVLELWLEGLTGAEIAARRGVGPRTISKQVSAIYRKLGVSSRSQLAVKLARPR